jgi:hypothetical protein
MQSGKDLYHPRLVRCKKTFFAVDGISVESNDGKKVSTETEVVSSPGCRPRRAPTERP